MNKIGTCQSYIVGVMNTS